MGTDCLFGLFAANTFIVIPLLLLGAGMLLVPTGLTWGQLLLMMLLAIPLGYIAIELIAAFFEIVFFWPILLLILLASPIIEVLEIIASPIIEVLEIILFPIELSFILLWENAILAFLFLNLPLLELVDLAIKIPERIMVLEGISAIPYAIMLLNTPVLLPAFFLFPILLLLFIPVDLFNKALVGLVAWPITMWIPGQLPLYLL